MIDNEQKFIEVVNNSVGGHNQEIRSTNESILMNFILKQSNDFVTVSTKLFQKSDMSLSSRISIGTVIQLSLRPVDSENGVSIWGNISHESKEALKSCGLDCLIDTNDIVRNSAATLTAAVFVLDAKTDKSWFELLDILAQNIENEDQSIMKAAINTLGYICEYLKMDQVIDLPVDKTDSLIAGICNGLKDFSVITVTSLNALSNSLDFLKSKLEREDFSDYILQLLINLIAPCIQNNDEKSLFLIIRSLAFICKIIFARFLKYKDIIFTRLVELYNLDNNPLHLALNEYFIKMLKLENNFKTNYFAGIWRHLSDISISKCQSLFSNKSLDYSEVKSETDSYCHILSYLNAIGGLESYQNFMKYIYANIESDQEPLKLCGILVFEALLEFSNPADIQGFFHNGFFSFLGYLKLGSSRVKIQTSSVFAKAANLFPSIFLNDQNCVRFIPEFCAMLSQNNLTEDDDVFKYNLCDCLREVIESINPKSGSSSLTMYIDRLYDSIQSFICSSDNLHLIDFASTIIFEINQNVLHKNDYSKYFYNLSRFLSDVYQNYNRDIKCKEMILNGLLINIYILLTLTERKRVVITIPNKIVKDFLIELYLFVERIIVTFPSLKSEGFQLLNVIIIQDQPFADNIPGSFYEKYVMEALKDPKNIDTFKAGLTSFEIFIKKFKIIIEPTVDQYFRYFLEILSSASNSKDLQLAVFRTMSDLIMEFPNQSLNFVEPIFSFLAMGMEGVIHMVNTNNKKLIQYSEFLRSSLIECFEAMLHSIYHVTSSKDAEFYQMFQKYQTFIQILSDKKLNPTIEFIKESTFLIFDFWMKNQSMNGVNRELFVYLKNILCSIQQPTQDIKDLLNHLINLDMSS